MKTTKRRVLLVTCISLFIINHLVAQDIAAIQSGKYTFELPKEFLTERKDIPSFWISTNEEIDIFIENNVKKGEVEIIGVSAGGRPIKAISYGEPRKWEGTTTFSGALGFRDVGAYRGPDHDKTVFMVVSGIHGGEFEGIAGTVNLISVIETGKDLRGKEWPEVIDLVEKIDRLVLIPIANPDGRARVPIRMQIFRGKDRIVHEYLNTGGHADGTIFGWPQIKEFIPMDFSKPGFPGGYPNDAGVNIMHDDFFGVIQPETEALFNISAREKPDITMNMHTGADYMNLLRPFSEQSLQPMFDSIYTRVHARLAHEGMLRTKDVQKESDPSKLRTGGFNLTSALNLHCGTLCVTVESPSHGYDRYEDYSTSKHTPDLLLDSHFYCHIEAMRFLVESGGRSNW